MKITVLIPSEEYRLNAGARIRYGRIAPRLAAAGHQLVLEDINSFDPLTATCAVAIISKCHDARSLMCACVLGARGIKVGVDLFDDYFSQMHDSRMARYRDWLAGLVHRIDFVLCSTPAMVKVAHRYHASLPVHVMNDPMAPQAIEQFNDSLKRKGIAARDNRTIDLCWFGMGDNPHFRVGLSDLAAFGSALAEPSKRGFDVRLKVLTNSRALDADGLSLLSRLPVEVTVEEWSPAGEAAALAQATACILPVNAQHFSIAKSLNRAVSALSAGCQVIAMGYPLYAPLKSLIYREILSLAVDLEDGRALLRPETFATYAALMDSWASPENEASRLASFLEERLADCESHESATLPPIAIVHGKVTSGAVHKFGQRLGALAVRSPFCAAKLGYDVFFGGAIGQRSLDMFVTARTVDRLRPAAREKARKAGMIANQHVWALSARGEPENIDWSDAPLAVQLAVYAETINEMHRQIEEAFGSIAIIVSETSPHAFSARAA